MFAQLQRFVKEEDGQTYTEYVLIGGVVAIALIGAAIYFRDQIGQAFHKMGDAIKSAW